MKRIIGLVTCLSMLSGCALMLTHPPTPRSVMYSGCPSRGPAGVDTYFAISNGVGALITLSRAGEGDEFGLLGLAAAAFAAVHAASASYGFKQVRACRELRNSLAYSPPLPPPPTYDVPPTIEIEGDPIVIEQEEEKVETRTTTRTRIHVE